MGEYTPLKYYFNEELAVYLSRLIEPHYPYFNTISFIENIQNKVEDKELKARVAVIGDELKNHLPENYEDALAILLQILGPENEFEEGMFTKGYFLMPVAYFVEKYGLHHFDVSMLAIVEITKRHTSEYAIRPYLSMDIDRCLAYLHDWIINTNSHVRRLVSESTRPRLPWAKKMNPMKNDPINNLRLLENLMKDPSPYVQKSVANHINDLSKDAPEVVLSWIKTYKFHHENVNARIIKHGLRTLIKQKEQEALDLINEIEKR
ncbi:DNA alkylation repair protein [Pseudogracilibacillus sp. SO30301A]|uniref:DNA alkylation repair protein n=1 Tax=Pseudogracilibacillus sp. SO30301A TaxID=3098291 RepID=UPI00300E57C2